MALILGKTTNHGMLLVQTTKDDKEKVMNLTEFEKENLFFYLINHERQLFSKVKTKETKSEIVNILIATELEAGE